MGETIEEKLIRLTKMFPNMHVALVFKEGDNDYDVYLGVRDYPFRRGFPATEALDRMLTLTPSEESDCPYYSQTEEA